MTSKRAAKSPDEPRAASWILSLAAIVALLALSSGVIWWIYNSEPDAKRVDARRRTAMLVETTGVARGSYEPRFVVIGQVQAKEDVQLSPRVEGQIVEQAQAFEAGRLVKAGEWLVKLDRSDYENTVAQRTSALHQAEAELDVEMGRQRVAQLDYELLKEEVPVASLDLILRKPQLDVAKANVEAAKALLEQAKLELSRTTIRAPFDAQVLSREVAVGSQVASGASLGRLVGVEEYWVVASVPLDKLRHIKTVQTGGGQGSKASMRHRTAWPASARREGRVENLIGALDGTTRLARVNIRVEDPLAIRPANRDQPQLVIGTLLEVTIVGAPIEGVIRIERAHLREDSTVWVKRDGKLRILPVEVAFMDADHAYISEGLPEDARVVTSGLSSVVDGAALRLRPAATPGGGDGDK